MLCSSVSDLWLCIFRLLMWMVLSLSCYTNIITSLAQDIALWILGHEEPAPHTIGIQAGHSNLCINDCRHLRNCRSWSCAIRRPSRERWMRSRLMSVKSFRGITAETMISDMGKCSLDTLRRFFILFIVFSGKSVTKSLPPTWIMMVLYTAVFVAWTSEQL